ncbi:MAG: hypothetical protein SH850_20910 [Planctomycetaceae bacterium]|nr:hypothetical protein [Planctomycetaceae bacterium]
MSVRGPIIGLRMAVVVAACATLVTAGCTFFPAADLSLAVNSSRPVLPPIKPPNDAVQLQIVFVERPCDDTLINQLIWQQVDQVGALSPEARMMLHDHGFRVGQCGAQPPPAVQTLLGLSVELVDENVAGEHLMRGRRLGLRSGQDTEILTVDSHRDCTVRYLTTGQEEIVEYEQARSVLRLRPVRVQDGWVRVEFTPEIHHGAAQMRHTPTEEGWALKGGQKTDVRQSLKFSVTLNTGELAIISGDPTRDHSPGEEFFCQEQADGRRTQRLLVVRLSDAGNAEK